MKSASKEELIFERAKHKDIKDLINLIYITEPIPEEEWGYGSEKQKKQTLKRLLKTKNNRFSIQNIIVARKENKLVGMALLLEGKKINQLTKNAEKQVIAGQKGFLNKLGMIYTSIKGKFHPECEEDEYYISNIAIKPEYRGNGYAKLFFDQAFKIAKRKKYQKASLIAKNDKLIQFYQTLGFHLQNQKQRRMTIDIV